MLLKAFSIQDLKLSSRIVMAPMTRCAASARQVPSKQMAAYYRDRASVGLIIAEATCISPCANAYPNTPGIYHAAQVKGWKSVTNAVHAKGGKIFVQLWHAGMMGHSHFRKGDLPLSPSGVPPFRKRVPRSGLLYEEPRIMCEKDFDTVKKNFAQAAIHAKEAGFDGVELYSSGGYLLDSFLHHHTNRRTDRYGEEKIRFILEVVDTVKPIIRTGIRLSPVPLVGMENMLYDNRDLDVYRLLFKELERRELAYVHAATDQDAHPELGRVTRFMRQHYSGILIGGGGYTPQSAAQSLKNGDFDLVSFGRLLMANPNLIDLIEKKKDLKSFSYEMVNNPPTLSPAPDGTSIFIA